jgi:hypothetical protein
MNRSTGIIHEWCHAERSEESLTGCQVVAEILRLAQNACLGLTLANV